MTENPRFRNADDTEDPRHVATAALPTQHGEFRILVFESSEPTAFGLSREPVALVKGEVAGGEGVLVRLQSECITGEVFASLRCDCRDQLALAQQAIAREGSGVIVYLRQEGRGIGLSNKVKAYALQDLGVDTVDANLQLHLPVDARHYEIAGAILRKLGVRSVRLLSNNPEKERGLSEFGIPVIERVAVPVHATPYSAKYLETKRVRLHHDLAEVVAAGPKSG